MSPSRIPTLRLVSCLVAAAAIAACGGGNTDTTARHRRRRRHSTHRHRRSGSPPRPARRRNHRPSTTAPAAGPWPFDAPRSRRGQRRRLRRSVDRAGGRRHRHRRVPHRLRLLPHGHGRSDRLSRASRASRTCTRSSATPAPTPPPPPTRSLGSGASTCRGGTANRSAYWVPTMIDTQTGTPDQAESRPHVLQDRLQRREAVAGAGPCPPGLRMIAGDSKNSKAEGPFKYACIGKGSEAMVGHEIQNCPVGAQVWQLIYFPQCWDGVNLDSPGPQEPHELSGERRVPEDAPGAAARGQLQHRLRRDRGQRAAALAPLVRHVRQERCPAATRRTATGSTAGTRR
jgi:hypothetical protein